MPKVSLPTGCATVIKCNARRRCSSPGAVARQQVHIRHVCTTLIELQCIGIAQDDHNHYLSVCSSFAYRTYMIARKLQRAQLVYAALSMWERLLCRS